MITRYTYDQSIEQLEQLYRLPFIPASRAGLRRGIRLLQQLGNPQQSFRAVHVTGSAGKGSTTTIVGSILQAAGFRTGYFRSPHLTAYTERISVDGRDIERHEWESCFNQAWPLVETMRDNRLPGYDLGRPSLFEVLFALMSLHFAEANVEWAAIEAGMGGRLDPTNVLLPDVTVVTNVSLEHTQVLGRTVREIAIEKAAIIKPGTHAVTACDDPEALEIVVERAREVGSHLIRVGRDVTVSVHAEDLTGQNMTLRGDSDSLDVRLPLAGSFQAVNAATAFGVALALRDRGVPLSHEAVAQGMEAVRLPGRLELLSREPAIVLDGGHNPAAMRELARSLGRLAQGRPLVLLFAAMSDKDLRSMAEVIAPMARSVVLTVAPGTERAAGTAALLDAFAPWDDHVIAEDDAERAVELALRRTEPGSILLITGSLYLVGYARQLLPALGISP